MGKISLDNQDPGNAKRDLGYAQDTNRYAMRTCVSDGLVFRWMTTLSWFASSKTELSGIVVDSLPYSDGFSPSTKINPKFDLGLSDMGRIVTTWGAFSKLSNSATSFSSYLIRWLTPTLFPLFYSKILGGPPKGEALNKFPPSAFPSWRPCICCYLFGVMAWKDNFNVSLVYSHNIVILNNSLIRSVCATLLCEKHLTFLFSLKCMV